MMVEAHVEVPGEKLELAWLLHARSFMQEEKCLFVLFRFNSFVENIFVSTKKETNIFFFYVNK